MAKFVFLIDGPISVGKSELLKYLDQHKEEFTPFLQPEQGETLETVLEFYDQEALDIYYRFRDQIPNYNELFEMGQLIGRQVRLLKAKEGKGIYAFDRGMISGVKVFTETAFEEGNLTLQTRERIYDQMKLGIDILGRKEPLSWLEQVVFYLQVKDSNILDERRSRRNSQGEEKIPQSYLTTISRKYEEYYADCQKAYREFGLPTPRVIPLDGSIDYREDQQYFPSALKKIRSTMEEMFRERR